MSTAADTASHPLSTNGDPTAQTTNNNILTRVRFRDVRPTDIPTCFEIEKASYPPDEAASLSSLQYRQHHAAPYFRCAILLSDNKQDDDATVIGFICSTRCQTFNHDSMSTHVPDGRLLAIHSVAVESKYRRQGVATALLKDYIQTIKQQQDDNSIERMVLIAKAQLLTFYVNCGFQVTRPSAIVHGGDVWYDLELDLNHDSANKCFIVDAFVDPQHPTGTGNPAAVVLCKDEPENGSKTNNWHDKRNWMQNVAAEFNLAETAFIWPLSTFKDSTMSEHSDNSSNHAADESDEEQVHYGIRYYTPTMEVPLCGHATLASAAILYQTVVDTPKQTTICFHALEDMLLAKQQQQQCRGDSLTRITMEFPIKPAVALNETDQALAMLQEALGIQSVLFVGLSDIGDLLVEVTPESFVRIGYDKIHYNALAQWNGYSRGVIVSCVAPPTPPNNESSSEDDDSNEVDFLSRFFAPKAGIDEDHVTGSAHCVLAPYYGAKFNKDHVVGHQQSRRGGIVDCQLVRRQDDMISTVQLTGSACTVVKGTLLLEP